MAQGRVIACHTEAEWKEQLDLANQSQKLVIVDFTAAWCPPCRFVAPIFAEVSQEFPDIVFLKVDVDELNSVAEEYGVQAMPTFLFIKDGKVIHKTVGAMEKPALVQKIQNCVEGKVDKVEDEEEDEDDEE